MFAGARVKFSVTITTDALALIRETRRELEPVYGSAATDAAAAEYLIRRGAARDRRGRHGKRLAITPLADLKKHVQALERKVSQQLKSALDDVAREIMKPSKV